MSEHQLKFLVLRILCLLGVWHKYLFKQLSFAAYTQFNVYEMPWLHLAR